MKGQLTMFSPRRPLLERFGADFFRQVPERPGVYLMCSARDGVLYVGKAVNLRRRLASYRSADPERVPRKLRRLLAEVERIVWDECADEATALERESELLQAMRPRFNTVGVRPPMPDYLGWRITEGRLVVGLGAKTADLPDRHGPDVQSRRIYGPLLRSLWWALHPAACWDQIPARLRKAKVPAAWSFKVETDSIKEVPQRLARFFRGESPELAEWCVWSAARRPLFERTWAGHDALALLEFYERLTEVPESRPKQVSPIDDCAVQGTVSSGVEPGSFALEDSNGPFPLTPTLSLREREERIPLRPKVGRVGVHETRADWLPLPKGEGRGEGKGNSCPSTAANPSESLNSPS